MARGLGRVMLGGLSPCMETSTPLSATSTCAGRRKRPAVQPSLGAPAQGSRARRTGDERGTRPAAALVAPRVAHGAGRGHRTRTGTPTPAKATGGSLMMAQKRRSVVLPGQIHSSLGGAGARQPIPAERTQARGSRSSRRSPCASVLRRAMDDAHDLAASTAGAARHRVSTRRHAVPGHRSAGLAHMFGQGWHLKPSTPDQREACDPCQVPGSDDASVPRGPSYRERTEHGLHDPSPFLACRCSREQRRVGSGCRAGGMPFDPRSPRPLALGPYEKYVLRGPEPDCLSKCVVMA